MFNATSRFSNRAEVYDKFRPRYPLEALNIIQSHINVDNPLIADIGAGTGIMTQHLSTLSNNSTIYCVEPNSDMLQVAKNKLSNHDEIIFSKSPAEKTNINNNSIDLIVAAQAFHWFDLDKTKNEFQRILKNDGIIALIWNKRKETGTKFLDSYEKFLIKYAKDYQSVRYKNINSKNDLIDKQKLRCFFGKDFQEYKFVYKQEFDFEDLKGRLLSSLYSRLPEEEGHTNMMKDLRGLFDECNENQKVKFLYDTILIVCRGIT